MSTSIYLHGVTYGDVLSTLPVDVTEITANSKGLNFGQIDSFIAIAAGMVNAQLVRHGIVPESIDENTSQIARQAIQSYAAAFCLERLNAPADRVERRRQDFNTMFKLLKEEPQALGSAEDAAQSTVKSNISRSDCDRSKWRTGSYRY